MRDTESKPMQALRAVAEQYPGVDAGPVCTRTAFKAGTKSFFFLGMNDDTYNIMVKLPHSQGEAEALAEREPEHYKVGVHGWVTATLPHSQTPPDGVFERWIDESYRALAPKKLVAQLDDSGEAPARARKSPAKKSATAAKKKTAARRR